MGFTTQNRVYSLLFTIITIVCHSQCPEQNAKCADIAYNGVIWGTHNANGIDVSSYTNNELSFIGCGGGCGQSSFTCTDTSSDLSFGTFQTGAGGSFPMDAQLQALTTSTFECSADGSPLTRRRLSHAPGDQVSVDALCYQLGYVTGEFVQGDWGNGCPDVEYQMGPTSLWWSDFTPTPLPTPQGAHSITCSNPRGLQAPCDSETDCCGELLCDFNNKCCIPQEINIYDCEMDDNNCCSNLFCNSDGICNDCRTQGGICDNNSDCCDETLGIVCKFNGICDWCAKIGNECDVSNDCCDNLICNQGDGCIEPTMEPTMAPSTYTKNPTITLHTTTSTKKPTGSSSESSESSDSSSSDEVSNAMMNNDKPGDNDGNTIETQKLSDLMSRNIWIITLAVFILIFICCVLICILKNRKTKYRTVTKLPPINS